MFASLSEKLSEAFKKFRNKGKLTEADVRTGMREVKMALLEADVNFKVVKEFVGKVTERAVGSEVLESLVPYQQVIKIVNEDLKERYAAIKIPALLIFGDKDKETPLYMARKMNRLVKNSKLIVIKNAGHFCFVDKPNLFNGYALEFLLRGK